jgi:glycosyltransferase involved in cell wall biosynthesis
MTIVEAMAMGKAIVSTPAGVNGLDLNPGTDIIVTRTAQEMADAIRTLFDSPYKRYAIEEEARKTVEQRYGWDSIAGQQLAIYRDLLQ